MPVTDPNTLTRGIKAQFQRAYASVLESVEMTGIESVATTIVSDGASETYNWLGDVPAIKEWLADKTMGDLADQTYSITNKDFYTGITVDRNALEDEQINGIPERVAFMARAMALHKAELISDLVTNGTTDTAYDSSAFFANRTAPNDNLLAGSGTTLAQIKADIQSTRAAMMKFTDPNTSRVLHIIGDTIYCPPELEGSMLEVVGSTTDPSLTGSANFNATNRFIKAVVADPRLSDANDWYLLATTYPLKPFIFQERKAPTIVLDRTEEARNRKIHYSVESRRNAGYGFFQMAAKVVNS